jgi:hypothetical protein
MKSDKPFFQKTDYEKTGFMLLFCIMAVYYGYRLFALTPWYDELYTYYYFISRGPVYAAIHWPVPNNHVGYSVLSALLDYLGNPYIGLRGISYVCALLNLILLFALARKFYVKGLALITVILYLSMKLVNQLALQGRGYTLGITCYLAALLCLVHIGTDRECRKRYFILFGLMLVLALYTIPSNVYFVLPLCLTGGIYLLLSALWGKREDWGRLIRLIVVSLLAAGATVCLYALIWLAIGSNLLVKEEGSGYFGMGHLQLLRKAPLKALKTGMDYMLATPYIQSVERQGFVKRLLSWFHSLFQMYYDGLGTAVACLLGLAVLCLISALIFALKNREREAALLVIFLLTGIFSIPLMLLIQHTLPYYRVFTFGGVLVALSAGFLLQCLFGILGKIQKYFMKAALAVCILSALYCFICKDYQSQYGTREYELKDALSHSNIQEAVNPCVTDCTQQYLIRFLYGITCENTEIEGADFLLLDKKMLDKEYGEMEWEFYHYYNTIPWDYVDNNMKPVYENEGFVLYIKTN